MTNLLQIAAVVLHLADLPVETLQFEPLSPPGVYYTNDHGAYTASGTMQVELFADDLFPDYVTQTVVIKWAPAAGPVVLEQTDDLQLWEDIRVVLIGVGQWMVYPNDTTRFYRLRQL